MSPVVPSEQLIDGGRGARSEPREPAASSPAGLDVQSPWAQPPPGAERAARVALRSQVERLERELSGLVAGRFPHIGAGVGLDASAPPGGGGSHRGGRLAGGPRLLSLADLERERDRLALRVREARVRSEQREELERDARKLLERMRAEPARYKLVRLPVAALGERGCGVWEVRPRLGLIGMLAGWWELKLSSGCPLAGGSRTATPSSSSSSAAQTATTRRQAPARHRRLGASIARRQDTAGSMPAGSRERVATRSPRAWSTSAVASSADEHRLASAPGARLQPTGADDVMLAVG